MDKKVYKFVWLMTKLVFAAISLVLDKRHVRNGGKYPIALRFTIDRKRIVLSVGR